MASISITASGLIVQNQHVLLVEFKQKEQVFYNLPGGGLKRGETLQDALRREVLEETGAQIDEIGRLLVTWQYEPERTEFKYGKKATLGMVFMCQLFPHSQPRPPKKPDKRQIGTRWLPLDELPSVDLHPSIGGMIHEMLTTQDLAPRFYTVL